MPIAFFTFPGYNTYINKIVFPWLDISYCEYPAEQDNGV